MARPGGNGAVAQARHDVEENRAKLESALDLLEDKIEDTFQRAELMVYRAKAPVRLARRYPWGNIGVSLLVGLLVGAWLGDSR